MILKNVIVLSTILLSTTAVAADGFYEKAYGAPNVYGPGWENTTFFTRPANTPRNAVITNVAWDWGQYNNGATKQEMRLCYRTEYTGIQKKCIPITDTPIGITDEFNGISARVEFNLIHVLEGGTYPVYPYHDDYIRVEYSY